MRASLTSTEPRLPSSIFVHGASFHARADQASSSGHSAASPWISPEVNVVRNGEDFPYSLSRPTPCKFTAIVRGPTEAKP